jgi:hypothetical protein
VLLSVLCSELLSVLCNYCDGVGCVAKRIVGGVLLLCVTIRRRYIYKE